MGKTPSSLYYLNYPTFIRKIVRELDIWKDLPLSLFGRSHLVKMISFSKLLYPLQTLPLLLRHSDINKLTKAIQIFIWQGKSTRIKLQKLYLDKHEGGLGPPNIRVYNIACMLRYALDWIMGGSCFTNREIEHSPYSDWSLSAILNSDFYRPLPGMRQHALFRDTMVAWWTIHRKQGVVPTLTRHTPIQRNPNFAQGVDHTTYVEWERKGLTKFYQIYCGESQRLKIFPELPREFHLLQHHRL